MHRLNPSFRVALSFLKMSNFPKQSHNTVAYTSRDKKQAKYAVRSTASEFIRKPLDIRLESFVFNSPNVVQRHTTDGKISLVDGGGKSGKN